MFYTIYQITNTITNDIYIGQHVTHNLNDKYMGSGKRLQFAFRKYGKENFTKEILYIFDNFNEMNLKEIEIVNEEFLNRQDTYNLIKGGSYFEHHGTRLVSLLESPGKFFRIPINEFDPNKHGTIHKGTVPVELKNSPGKFFRIPIEDMDKTIHRTAITGTIYVYNILTNEYGRITIDEYNQNKKMYRTASTGRVTVINTITNETLSVNLDKFDPAIHKKVFGGIVAIKDNIKQYVTADEFIENNLHGVHKGKVTALDKETGIKKHISIDEFYANRSRYIPNGTGTTIVKDKTTGSITRIPTKLVDKECHIVGTTGWATVYDIALKKFINIPKGTLDKSKHKLSNDKKFICYAPDGTQKFEFWGGKQEFISMYNCPASVWDTALKNGTFKSDRLLSKEFNGCKFTIINWKP